MKLPPELEKLRDELAKEAYQKRLNKLIDVYNDVQILFKEGFNACYEIMSNKVEYDGLLVYGRKIEVLKNTNKELKAQLATAIEALKTCATRKECKGYECCASCGPIDEAVETLAKLQEIK